MQCLTTAGCAILSILAGPAVFPRAAHAETVIDEWANVKLPPAPALKPVTPAANGTAILAMDFTTQTCTPQRQPRCANQVPQVADGMSGDDVWPEAYTTRHLAKAARIGPQVTLTRWTRSAFSKSLRRSSPSSSPT